MTRCSHYVELPAGLPPTATHHDLYYKLKRNLRQVQSRLYPVMACIQFLRLVLSASPLPLLTYFLSVRSRLE